MTQHLLEAAKVVVAAWEHGDLAAAVRELDAAIQDAEEQHTSELNVAVDQDAKHQTSRSPAMRMIHDLSLDELRDIVSYVQQQLYLEVDDKGDECWNPDKEVSGADFIESVNWVLSRYDLIPQSEAPLAP